MPRLPDTDFDNSKHAVTTIHVDVTPPHWRKLVAEPKHFGPFMSMLTHKMEVVSVMADAHSLVLEFYGVHLLRKALEAVDGKELIPTDLNIITSNLRKEVEVLALESTPPRE